MVKSQLLQPGGRTVQINYLVRGGRIVDVYFNGTVSDLATRRDEFASILAGGGGANALVKTLQRAERRLAPLRRASATARDMRRSSRRVRLIVCGLKREASILAGANRMSVCGDAPTLQRRLAECGTSRPNW